MLKNLDDKNIMREINMGEGLLIVEVGATWCGSCYIMEPILSEIDREYHNKLTIGKINIEYAEEIVVQYGIKNLPTYLFFKNGELVDQIVGALSKTSLSNKISTLNK